MIVICEEAVEQLGNIEAAKDVFFNCWDDGDVYSMLNAGYSQDTVPGTIYQTNDQQHQKHLSYDISL